MQKTLPIRNSCGNGISAAGSRAPWSNSTRLMAVASPEYTEKLTPPRTSVAPNGKGRPARTL